MKNLAENNRPEEESAIRILLAEDNAENQFLMKSILEDFGYAVDVAGNGLDAIEALEKNEYSLVFMDCMMPKMDGLQATAKIRDMSSNVKNHHIPIIALTGKVMKEDISNCLKAGMDDNLSKPFQFTQLIDILEKWTKNLVDTRKFETQKPILENGSSKFIKPSNSDFVSKMGHELRSPLNIIIGYAQMLKFSKSDPLNNNQLEHVEEILNGSWKLLDLINGGLEKVMKEDAESKKL